MFKILYIRFLYHSFRILFPDAIILLQNKYKWRYTANDKRTKLMLLLRYSFNDDKFHSYTQSSNRQNENANVYGRDLSRVFIPTSPLRQIKPLSFLYRHYVDPIFINEILLQVFSPGDYICRKRDVGKEMYIVKRGRLQVCIYAYIIIFQFTSIYSIDIIRNLLKLILMEIYWL